MKDEMDDVIATEQYLNEEPDVSGTSEDACSVHYRLEGLNALRCWQPLTLWSKTPDSAINEEAIYREENENCGLHWIDFRITKQTIEVYEQNAKNEGLKSLKGNYEK